MSVRHPPASQSPLPRLAFGLACLAVAGFMSMTFFEAEWSNPSTVTLVLAILGFTGASGLYLLATGLARLGADRERAIMALETPAGALALGEAARLRLAVAPGRELELGSVGLEAWIEERAEGAEGLGEALVEARLGERVEPVSRPIGAGETRTFDLAVEVPVAAPGTLALERHGWALRVRARLTRKDGAVVTGDFAIPVRARLATGASLPAPELEAGETAGFEAGGWGLALRAPGGAPGVPVGAVGGRLEAELAIRGPGGRGLRISPRLVRWVGGAHPEEAVVLEAPPLDAGKPEPGAEVRVPVGLDLPEGLAPSYEGPAFAIAYRLELEPEPEAGLGEALPAFPVVVRPARG